MFRHCPPPATASADTGVNFRWLDGFTLGPSPATYDHWGQLPGGASEPRADGDRLFCGAGNFSEGWQGVSGWANVRCRSASVQLVSICRLLREWRQRFSPFIWEAALKAGASIKPHFSSESCSLGFKSRRISLAAASGPVVLPANYSASSGGVFRLYNTRATAAQARAMCNAQGAHLASFSSGDEQNEVEQWLVDNVGDGACSS